MIGGVAMLGGSVAGGVIAQVLLGVLVPAPRGRVAGDVRGRVQADARPRLHPGPQRGSAAGDAPGARGIARARAREPAGALGDACRPVRLGCRLTRSMRCSRSCSSLYGDPDAYAVAGLAAAIIAGSQILGGWAAPRIRRLFAKRTTALILGGA